MTLTEQWKKGELKEGWYYIRNKAHSIKFNQMAFFMVFGEVSYWTNCKDEDVEEVLAPVPSYEEWKKVFNCANKYEVEYIECANDYENVKKENQQLKDVISKMCMELVDPDDDMSNGLAEYFNQDLLLEINEVLK